MNNERRKRIIAMNYKQELLKNAAFYQVLSFGCHKQYLISRDVGNIDMAIWYQELSALYANRARKTMDRIKSTDYN